MAKKNFVAWSKTFADIKLQSWIPRFSPGWLGESVRESLMRNWHKIEKKCPLLPTPPIEKKNELSKPYFYVLYMQGSTLHFHPNTILASACRIRYLCMYLTSLLQYRVSWEGICTTTQRRCESIVNSLTKDLVCQPWENLEKIILHMQLLLGICIILSKKLLL